MEMIGKIRRVYVRDKLSLHEITKRMGFVAQHDTPMGEAAGDGDADLPAEQRSKKAQRLSRNAGTGTQGRRAPSEAQSPDCQSAVCANKG